MSANVYTLASPSPTLYIYPSQIHPAAPQVGSTAPLWQGAIHSARIKRRRRDEEIALAVLGAI